MLQKNHDNENHHRDLLGFFDKVLIICLLCRFDFGL